jgi:hypothetical protein
MFRYQILLFIIIIIPLLYIVYVMMLYKTKIKLGPIVKDKRIQADTHIGEFSIRCLPRPLPPQKNLENWRNK